MMLDANQAWDVGEAIEFMHPLERFSPLWIEEPDQPRRHPRACHDSPRVHR